jgi:hypothetical protein
VATARAAAASVRAIRFNRLPSLFDNATYAREASRTGGKRIRANFVTIAAATVAR